MSPKQIIRKKSLSGRNDKVVLYKSVEIHTSASVYGIAVIFFEKCAHETEKSKKLLIRNFSSALRKEDSSRSSSQTSEHVSLHFISFFSMSLHILLLWCSEKSNFKQKLVDLIRERSKIYEKYVMRTCRAIFEKIAKKKYLPLVAKTCAGVEVDFNQ